MEEWGKLAPEGRRNAHETRHSYFEVASVRRLRREAARRPTSYRENGKLIPDPSVKGMYRVQASRDRPPKKAASSWREGILNTRCG